MRTEQSPAKLLASAKNAAGDLAVNAAAKGDHVAARDWSGIAVKIDALIRETVEALARA